MKISILLIICATLALAVSSFDQETVAQITRNTPDKTIADKTGKSPLVLETARRFRPSIRCRKYRKQSIKKNLENQNLSKFGVRLIKVSGKQLRILRAGKSIVHHLRRRYLPAHRRKGTQRQRTLCKEDPVNIMTLASDSGFAYTFNSVTCGTKQKCKASVGGSPPTDIGRCQPNKKQIAVKVFRRHRGSQCRRFGTETISIACACQCYRF